MKKILVLILTLAVGLPSCGGKSKQPPHLKKRPESEKSFFGRFLRAKSRKI